MPSTTGILLCFAWDKLTLPTLWHCGQQISSFHWSVMAVTFWAKVLDQAPETGLFKIAHFQIRPLLLSNQATRGSKQASTDQ
jgi:hypothetical protein